MHLDTLKQTLSNGKESREVETLRRKKKEKDLLKTVCIKEIQLLNNNNNNKSIIM